MNESLEHLFKIDKKETEFFSQANCVGTDPEAFFMEDRGKTYPPEVRRICRVCVVKMDCCAFAVKHNLQGYWGNTTEEERRSMRRGMRAA